MSYVEVYVFKEKKTSYIWIIAVLLILLSGFRFFVGADYGIYFKMFSSFIYTSYDDLWKKALFQPSQESTEWIYVDQ